MQIITLFTIYLHNYVFTVSFIYIYIYAAVVFIAEKLDECRQVISSTTLCMHNSHIVCIL